MQKEKVTDLNLQFNSRVLYEILGSEIIEADSIAIAEQIKNAKDANATKIIIDFSKMNEDLITIEDNGDGMSIEEIKNNWFFVGTNNKSENSSQSGGKGIGRFSLFRIANTIEVETVKNEVKSIFTLDKSSLSETELATDANIPIFQEEARGQDSQTVVKLTRINADIDLQGIKRDLENLQDPENSLKLFEIKYPENKAGSRYFKPDEAINQAPFYAVAEFEGEEVLSYEFVCEINGERIYANNVFKKNYKDALKNVLLNHSANGVNLGKTKIIIYNFYFDKLFKQWHGDIQEAEIKENFLAAYKGINVYRNGFKVYGHGEEDWLKLAETRLKKSSDNIDNKLTYGYLLLDSKESKKLREKTNREGFIKSKELTYFREIVMSIVKQFGLDRKVSIKAIKNYINMNQAPRSVGDKEIGNKGFVDTKNDGDIKDAVDGISTEENKGEFSNRETKYTEVATGDTDIESLKNIDTEGSNNEIPRGAAKDLKGEKTNQKVSPNIGNDKTKTYNNMVSKRIGLFDTELLDVVSSEKVRRLFGEILKISVYEYPLATATLFRSLIEITMDEFIRVNYNDSNITDTFNEIKKYKIDQNGLVRNIKGYSIPPKDKIAAFKKHLELKGHDVRSLRHLDDLAEFINDLNLSIHWHDKLISIDSLRTNWVNSKFFLEYMCKNI
ncbi:ATP-binding protein [Bacillus thuringiensis]|nr:ATP-binding protein [Bacillus thuringiensis]